MAYTGFGNIKFHEWYGTTINYTSTKNVKGIMRLIAYDEKQDMLVFERVEGVGYSGASITTIHVFLPTVASIHVESILDRHYEQSVDLVAKNPIAIAWMTEKAFRNNPDDKMPHSSTERYVRNN